MAPSHGPNSPSYMEHSLLPTNMTIVTYPLSCSDKPFRNKNRIYWTTTALDQLLTLLTMRHQRLPTPSVTNELCKGWEVVGDNGKHHHRCAAPSATEIEIDSASVPIKLSEHDGSEDMDGWMDFSSSLPPPKSPRKNHTIITNATRCHPP